MSSRLAQEQPWLLFKKIVNAILRGLSIENHFTRVAGCARTMLGREHIQDDFGLTQRALYYGSPGRSNRCSDRQRISQITFFRAYPVQNTIKLVVLSGPLKNCDCQIAANCFFPKYSSHFPLFSLPGRTLELRGLYTVAAMEGISGGRY
jgi:hypothetical protein